MPKKSHTSLLLVGTRKGAFVFSSKDGRKTWKASGPHFKGKEIYHIAYDRRNNILFASVNDEQWGPSVARSYDLGKTWKMSSAPKFPKNPRKEAVKRVWQIRPGPEDEPDVVYCGVEPATLFRSDDKGETWVVNSAMFTHKTRPKWVPGAGGLCLHSILVDENNPENCTSRSLQWEQCIPPTVGRLGSSKTKMCLQTFFLTSTQSTGNVYTNW